MGRGGIRLGLAVAAVLALTTGARAGTEASSPSVPSAARAEGAYDQGDPRVEARLVIDPGDGAGSAVRVGVLLDLDPGWHLYWRNPGDSGLPTRLRWRSDAAELGPIAWPAPTLFSESDGLLTTYGYAGQVLLASELYPRDVPPPRFLEVDVDVLACQTECIPASFSLARDLDEALREATRDPSGRSALHALFETYARALPVSPEQLGVQIEALYSQSAIRPGDRFRAALVVRSCASSPDGECPEDFTRAAGSAHFFPDRIDSIELQSAGWQPHPDDARAFLLALQGEAGPGDPGQDQRLSGVLALRGPDARLRHIEVDLALARAPAGDEVAVADAGLLPAGAPPASLQLGYALLLAFLGGLILNAMPCVLPVLAIKVFSIAELARQGRGERLAHGAAYAGGISLSMLGLACTVAALRAAGTQVGWGFQFQDPSFALAISAVLVVFALNLFGVFEFSAPYGRLASLGAQATGPSRSFFDGLLAVVLATPCSAPFLGTAVGFAFASPPAVIALVFLSIGLGLAFPIALAALVPASARLLPRSGVWMLKLRALLGFALLGTVVWLLWVLGRQAGVEGIIGAIAVLLVVAFAAWIYGACQSGAHPTRALGLSIAIGFLALLGAGVLRLEPTPVAAATQGDADWERFDPAAVAARLREGRPVLVYFTADWCITCAVNERAVIASDRVQAELRQRNVALIRADWTRRDDAITSELARFGKAGVPLALVYHPASPERPLVLPELLTVDVLLEALRGAPEPLAG